MPASKVFGKICCVVTSRLATWPAPHRGPLPRSPEASSSLTRWWSTIKAKHWSTLGRHRRHTDLIEMTLYTQQQIIERRMHLYHHHTFTETRNLKYTTTSKHHLSWTTTTILLKKILGNPKCFKSDSNIHLWIVLFSETATTNNQFFTHWNARGPNSTSIKYI